MSKLQITGIVLLVLIAIGILFGPIAMPFLTGWSPSEKAKSAGMPVEIELDRLKPDVPEKVKWRGKPIIVMALSEERKLELNALNEEVCTKDKELLSQEYIVMEKLSTYLGCVVQFQEDLIQLSDGRKYDGYFDPCYGLKYDVLGRALKSNQAPNLKKSCDLKRLKTSPFKLIDKHLWVGIN